MEPTPAHEWINPPEGEIKISDHFSWSEAVCHCCGKVPDVTVVRNTARWLEGLRALLGGHPLHINSWCRCPKHNREIGGVANSEHTRGHAVDVTSRGRTPKQVQSTCRRLQQEGRIGGLGCYSSFTHVDRGQPREWNGD